MEINWVTDIIMPLSSAFIGGLLALLGVYLTLAHDRKERNVERIDKAKPILVNSVAHVLRDVEGVPKLLCRSEGETSKKTVFGCFKNTDNGILFIDNITTETKTYIPENCSTIDKDTHFYLIFYIVNGETLKTCRINCHDIFGKKYYYDGVFDLTPGSENQIVIGNIQPVSDHEMKCKKT